MNTSVKRVKKSKLQQAIDDHKVEGWTLKSEGDNTSVMEKLGDWGSGFSHLIIFFLTFWFTFGAGNFAWAAYVHYIRDKQELQLKADLEE